MRTSKIKKKSIKTPMHGKVKKTNMALVNSIMENTLEKACTITYSTIVTMKSALIVKIAQISDDDIIKFAENHLPDFKHDDAQCVRTYLISRIAIEDGEEGLIDKHLVDDRQLRYNMYTLRKEQVEESDITPPSNLANILSQHIGSA